MRPLGVKENSKFEVRRETDIRAAARLSHRASLPASPARSLACSLPVYTSTAPLTVDLPSLGPPPPFPFSLSFSPSRSLQTTMSTCSTVTAPGAVVTSYSTSQYTTESIVRSLPFPSLL